MEQLELLGNSSQIIELRTKVPHNKYTEKLAEFFDFQFENEILTEIRNLPELPSEFGIGAIIGPSGSGKSTILKSINPEYEWRPKWDEEESVIAHFATPEEGIDKFAAVGFNSIPQMLLPYKNLSNGEQFRCDLARQLEDNALIDEYTSVVNRDVAYSTSNAFKRYVDKNNITGVVVASCHYDILEWLRPDWVFDTFNGNFYSGRYLQRPSIQIDIYRTTYRDWPTFQKHHYLSASVAKASHCYVGVWEENVVAFAAVMRLPGRMKNGWREHRLVVLPDFQGLGIGNKFSEAVAEIYLSQEGKYYSRTAHPSMGNYREKSELWKPTSKNRRRGQNVKHGGNKSGGKSGIQVWVADGLDRVCWSHEYIGKSPMNTSVNES